METTWSTNFAHTWPAQARKLVLGSVPEWTHDVGSEAIRRATFPGGVTFLAISPRKGLNLTMTWAGTHAHLY
ncbi:hypothetical protein NL676_008490 [Syzygium grande]|nr:hypothetical protein NL676_008490 [Syzygium grande]